MNLEFLFRPWPWYVAGPLIGLLPAVLLLLDNRLFGVSSNLRHLCAAVAPWGTDYLQYEWRREGGWNLAFAGGILAGGVIGGFVFANPAPVDIAESTRAALQSLGVQDFTGLVPSGVFTWVNLLTPGGAAVIVGGGFLVGFGTAYAGGCTSGHGLAGIADLQLPSLIALAAFFIGGVAGTFLLLPFLL